jgi:hypothetical protein
MTAHRAAPGRAATPQVGRFRQVAQRLSRLLQASMRSAFGAWRDAAAAAHTRRARALRMGRQSALHRALGAWQARAAQLAERGAQQLQAADRHYFEVGGLRALAGWALAVQRGRTRRAGLLRALKLVHAAEQRQLQQQALRGWAARAERQAVVRHRLQHMVARREARVLGEFFGLWQQYAAALRADGGLDAASPFLSPRSAERNQQLALRLAALAGGSDVARQVGGPGRERCRLGAFARGCAGCLAGACCSHQAPVQGAGSRTPPLPSADRHVGRGRGWG